MGNLLIVLGGVALFLLIVFGIPALLAWPTMWLWNWIIVGVFPGVMPLTYWMAFGLLVLLSIIRGFLSRS